MSIRVKSISNCPSGEYPAVFCSSTIEQYPKGKRQVLSFLIFGEDGIPKQNNMGECYYAVAVCNPSNGSNPKSKIHKVLKAMLTKEEYDPVLSMLTLPDIEEFLNNNKPPRFVYIRVNIVGDEKKASVITHIQRPRDKEWECIEGEFEGKYILPSIKNKNPKELFEKLKHKIKNKDFLQYAEEDMRMIMQKNSGYVDDSGNFLTDYDAEQISNTFVRDYYKRAIKFLETEDLKDLFTFLK